jgi:tetraacyldisaccharide 4'-kinase
VIAEHKFQSQLHLLDDGFQHRSLARDFDIVLMTERDFEDRLLPAGRLREPLSSLQRADAIVLPESASENENWKATIAKSPYRGKFISRMNRQISLSVPIVAPIVFCGIARPQQFFAQVRSAGITAAAEIEFRDHHAYGTRDIQRLTAMRAKLSAGGFLTTEKDAINLGSLAQELQQKLEPLSIVTLRLTIDNPDKLVDAILARFDNKTPRS